MCAMRQESAAPQPTQQGADHPMTTVDPITRVSQARLPRWLLPDAWPLQHGQPVVADIGIADGRITTIAPHDTAVPPDAGTWNVAGAPVLPGLVEAHTHIDKAFTLQRLGRIEPGLLGAIATMVDDRTRWTVEDVRARAGRSLDWAWAAGVVQLRTHCDWWEPATPLAWGVLRELADAWAGRIAVERVSLIPLDLFADRTGAMALARTVAGSGAGARLGAFVHSTNFDAEALRHVFEAAAEFNLDVDLHCDEELNAGALGLAATAALLRELAFGGRVVCGHTCALATMPEAAALATLDAVANVPITLISLPTTNLLLQDAATGRTPRQRGLTLVKEARERGIPLLFSSDNVQDAFCRIGSYDPVEVLGTAALVAQLDEPFDRWSETICRGAWLSREPGRMPLQPGAPADLVVFPAAEPRSFPTRAHARFVVRDGVRIDA
jgi:cytosine/creatinine deaminase